MGQMLPPAETLIKRLFIVARQPPPFMDAAIPRHSCDALVLLDLSRFGTVNCHRVRFLLMDPRVDVRSCLGEVWQIAIFK